MKSWCNREITRLITGGHNYQVPKWLSHSWEASLFHISSSSLHLLSKLLSPSIFQNSAVDNKEYALCIFINTIHIKVKTYCFSSGSGILAGVVPWSPEWGTLPWRRPSVEAPDDDCWHVGIMPLSLKLPCTRQRPKFEDLNHLLIVSGTWH